MNEISMLCIYFVSLPFITCISFLKSLAICNIFTNKKISIIVQHFEGFFFNFKYQQMFNGHLLIKKAIDLLFESEKLHFHERSKHTIVCHYHQWNFIHSK